MHVAEYGQSYRNTLDNFITWRSELSLLRKIVLSFAFACLTGIMAQIAIRLPWTPVPVTGQTFAVLISSMLLGRNWGGISQIIYAAIGITLIPWFSGWTGGIGVLAGPTGGYLIGFIIAAFFLGRFFDGVNQWNGFFRKLGLLLFANFIIIYGCGLLQLYIWISLVDRGSIGLLSLLMAGVFPFILGDLIKVVGAAVLYQGISLKIA
jgi:biotin transport system substrate-specific component